MKAKKINLNNNKAKMAYAIIILIVILLLVKLFSVLQSKMQETVPIVTLKTSMKSGDLISADSMVMGSVSRADYDRFGTAVVYEGKGKEITVPAVVAWEDREDFVDTFAANYIRKNTPLYADYTTRTLPDSNPWIAELQEGYEVIYMDINFLDLGGKTLIPGDRIRMRAVYQTKPDAVLNSKESSSIAKALAATYIGDSYSDVVSTLPVPAIVFEDIRIVDMLNSQGDSILKLYLDVAKYPISERQILLADREFVAKLTPIKVAFAVDRANGNKLAEVSQLQGAKFVYSTLKRDITDYITDFENINNAMMSVDPSRRN